MTSESLSRPLLLAAPLGLLVLFVTACGPAHWKGLQGMHFAERTVAAVPTAQPAPLFFSDIDEEIDDGGGGRSTVSRLLKAGTVLYRGYQEHGVAERLDSARSRVDLPARMSERLLERGAAALGASPGGPDSAEADYHLEIRLHRWGIGTDDWASNPYFLVEATLFLFERSTGREVWRGEVEEKDDLGGGLFSAGTVLGDVSTGRTLSNLTTDEIVTALEELSDYTADRLVQVLRDDLARARRQP